MEKTAENRWPTLGRILLWAGLGLLASALCARGARGDGVAVATSAVDNLTGASRVVTNVTFDAEGAFNAISNRADALIKAVAPAPGNYATVSNRAMTAIQSHQSLWPAVAAATNYTDDVAAEFANGTRSVKYAGYASSAEFSAEAGYVYNEFGNLVYNATDLIRASTNYTDAALGAFAATGSVARASTYGTPTRWTDATGCVWEVTLNGASWMDEEKELVWTNNEFVTEWHWAWGGIDRLQYSFGTWSYECGHRTASFVATAPEDATVLVMHDISTDPPLADVTLVRPQLTNLVGRVALTNDIPDVSGYATPADVTAAIREQSLGGIWDQQLGVWWTPIMQNGALRYVATTNVNLSAGGNQ